MTAGNGATPPHEDALLVVLVEHDGTAAISGCLECADPARMATMLRQIADLIAGRAATIPRGEG